MASPFISRPPTTFGAALTYVQSLLGWLVQEQESFPTAPITAPTAPFIGPNADRLGLLIANLGVNTTYISLSSGVNTTTGFLLNANGGAIAFDARTDFTLTTRAWWGLSVTAPNTLYVLEIIGLRPLPTGSVPGAV